MTDDKMREALQQMLDAFADPESGEIDRRLAIKDARAALAPLFVFEHDDGRRITCRADDARLVGEPAWHRVGPVESADSRRLDWMELNLFERKWGGTLGQSYDWYVRGDFRHTTQRMRGNDFRAAVDAAMLATPTDGGEG